MVCDITTSQAYKRKNKKKTAWKQTTFKAQKK